jgi:pimeloyl-ACP methyl ester carboxylesterase
MKSIAELEAAIATTKRQLHEPGARPESVAHWTMELFALENELAARRAEAKPVKAPRAVVPDVPARSIYTLEENEVNNTWYLFPHNAETVFVFVHGILSNGKTCWLNESDPLKPVFWPDLIAEDERFDHPAIFLGGFYTALDSGLYDMRDAARELMDALRREDEHGRPSVMSFRNVVFICHSTGGMVVRYLLTRHADEFAEKNLGLVLIASPSNGSHLANVLRFLSSLYSQKLGRQLEWDNESLQDLDDRFKSLLADREIPRLAGVEAFENHFIIHNKWLPDTNVVVEKESAARYFAEPRRLRETDHFTSVKPSSRRHPAYELLLDFYVQKFKPML